MAGFDPTADMRPFAIALAVIAGLALAGAVFDLDLSRVTEIGPAGLKLKLDESREEASAAVSELESRIALIEEKLDGLAREAASPEDETSELDVITEQTARVSDATAKLSLSARREQGTLLKGRQGYIWAGDFNRRTGVWDRSRLVRLDTGQYESKVPASVEPGAQYKVSANMVLRNGLPPNDAKYYRAKASLGVVPRSTVVTILEQPVAIDREFAVQYWVKVEVAE